MAEVTNSPVSTAISHLGLSLLRTLAEEGGNVFISPFSLSAALAMLHAGTKGRTREEVRHVCGYDAAGIDDDQVAGAFSQLLSSVEESAADSYILNVANSLVMQHNFPVKDAYKSLLVDSFKASLFKVDFQKETKKAVADINEWVKGKTNGMIPKLLDKLTPLTVMVLLNAIYFKGTWMNKFDKNLTTKQNFYNGGQKNKAKQVDMMHQKSSFGYTEKEIFTVLQMPYLGKNVSMMVLLPTSIDGLAELESHLTPAVFQELRKELVRKKVNVSLPKFKFEYGKSLVEELKKLGMMDPFGVPDFPNLTGMSDAGGILVTDVVHKAVIEVNEEGSEAAAATAVVIGLRSAPRKQVVPDFIVDRPFLFAIVDEKSGAVLFLGRIDQL